MSRTLKECHRCGENVMAQSLAKLLVHLIYSTKHRAKLLPHEPYKELHAFCGGVLKNHKCHLIEMNNVADHVHLLFDLHRTEALSDIVRELKASSSKWLKDQSPAYRSFEWQDGFGAFSLGMSQKLGAIAYLQSQQEKHAVISYEDEFRGFLDAYEVVYDERYVWD
jgi:REP element-mobilizing transposase RayT